MSEFCSKRWLLLVGFYLGRQIIPNLTEFAADNSGHQLIVRRMSCRTFYLTSRLKFQLTRGGLLNSVDSTWTQIRRSLWQNPRWSPLRSPPELNLRQTFIKVQDPADLWTWVHWHFGLQVWPALDPCGVRWSPWRSWWIRLGSTQVESAAGFNLVKSEPSESASDPRGAEADSSPPVRSPYLNSSSNFNFSGSFIPLPPVPNLLYSSSTFIVHLKYFLPLNLFLSLHLMYSILLIFARLILIETIYRSISSGYCCRAEMVNGESVSAVPFLSLTIPRVGVKPAKM